MDFYKVSNLYIQEGLQRKYLDEMEQRSNKKREEEKYDTIQPITSYAVSDSAREVETGLLKWVDDYQRSIKRKKKAEVVEIPKKWRPLDQELVKEYDDLEGNAPTAVRLTAPDLTPFNAEIDTYSTLLNKLSDEEKNIRITGQETEDRVRMLNDKKEAILRVVDSGGKKLRRKMNMDLMAIDGELSRLQSRLINIETETKQKQKDAQELIGKLQKVKTDKEEAIKPYEEAQKAFQGTAFNITRLPTETEEQYITRLQQNEELVINAQQKADLMRQGIISRFKKNIASLVLNAGLTEQINNTIENACNFDPDDVQARLFLNKNFIRFREYYNSYFGKRRNIDAPEFNEVTREFILPTGKSQTTTALPSTGLAPTTPIINGGKMIYDVSDGRQHLYLGYKGMQVFWSLTSAVGSWYLYKKADLDKIEELSGIGQDYLSDITMNSKGSPVKIKQFLIDEGYAPLQLDIKRKNNIDKDGNEDGTTTMGAGLRSKIPSTVPFGKYTLYLRKLIEHNVFKIKQGAYAVKGFPNRHVSDTVIKIIEGLLQDGKVRKTLYNELPHAEQIFLSSLLEHLNISKQAGVHKPADAQIHELEVIGGEISSGNNHPDLFKRAKHILSQLYKMGKIDAKEKKAYYDHLCS